MRKNTLHQQFILTPTHWTIWSSYNRSSCYMSNKIPNSLSFSSFYSFFLLFLSQKRDSSMQAPSQNSPLCAYQPSGLAQSYSTATTHHLYPLFSFCKIRSRKKIKRIKKKGRIEGKTNFKGGSANASGSCCHKD